MIQQIEIQLPEYKKGCYVITEIITKKIQTLPKKGIFYLHLHHTSAAITLNENFDPDVPSDLHQFLSKLIPENASFYNHTSEGLDDMPAHIKSSIIGNSLSIPIVNGKLKLGTWQGIYFCEFRNHGGSRSLTATIIGE